MCSFSLTPVPFLDPLHVKSVKTLFTNRTELNRTGVTYPLYVKKQSSYVAAMPTHTSFWFPTVLKYSNLHLP